MHRTVVLFAAALLCSGALAAAPAGQPGQPGQGAPPPGAPTIAAPPPAPLTPEETKKVMYAVGASIGKSLQNDFNLTPAELADVQKGMGDAVAGKPLLAKIEDLDSSPACYIPNCDSSCVTTAHDERSVCRKGKGHDITGIARKAPRDLRKAICVFRVRK